VIHDQIVGLCTSAGFHPRVFFESEHVLSTVSLIGRGFGVGFVPVSLAGAGIAGAVFVPLKRPPPRRFWYFVWNSDRETPGLQALVDKMNVFAKQSRGSRAMPSRR